MLGKEQQCAHLTQLILANLPPNRHLTSIHRAGCIRVDGKDVPVTALFDSGAVSASYVSEEFVKANNKELKQYLENR